MNNRGYVALITALALSLTLSAFAVAASESGLTARLAITTAEQRLQAAHHARSCIFIALLRLAQDARYEPYPGGASYSVNKSTGSTCVIERIEEVEVRHVIDASAQVGGGIQNATAVIDFSSEGIPRIGHWE